MRSAKAKTLVLAVAILAMFSVPTWAGGFGVYGSYWDSKDVGNSWGAGARAGFNFTKRLGLDFHATYYPDFKDDSSAGRNLDLTAIPVDGGLRFDFMPEKSFNVFVGGGVSYYFLSISPGSVDDKTGVYLNGGVDFGKMRGTNFFAEVIWRKVDTNVEFNAFHSDVKFDGLGINAGVSWRWGK